MSATPAEKFRKEAWAAQQSVPRFIRASDYAKLPPPDYVIEGIAVRGGIMLLAGESTVGKGFVMLSLAAAIAEGRPWMGRRTIRGSVCYLAFEADALQIRLRALIEHGHGELDDLYVLSMAGTGLSLSPTVPREGPELPAAGEQLVIRELQQLNARLEAEGRAPVVLVVIDTARSAMTGSEDSSDHVAPFLRAARRIRAEAAPNAVVAITHHTGWQDGENKRRRERGSSAWRGLVETTLYLNVESEAEDGSEAQLHLSVLKARDWVKGRPLRLIRRRVEIVGFDCHGEPLSSCLIERDPQTSEEREAAAAAARRKQEEARAAALEQRAVEQIRKHQITSQDALREHLGIGKTAVAPLVERLQSSGRVTKRSKTAPFEVVEESE